MKKLALLAALGLLFTGTAFAAPLSDQGNSTSDSKTMQSGQPGKANAAEKEKMGTSGSGMNSPKPTQETGQKDKTPASGGAGIKQEK